MTGFADGFRFSPDGKWIVYAFNDSGRHEIYKSPVGSFADRRQISIAGGVQPVWREDGKELYFLSLEGKLMSVAIVQGGAAAVPKVLFQTNAFARYNGGVYAPLLNGKRFLVLEPASREPDNIHIEVGWDAALGQ